MSSDIISRSFLRIEYHASMSGANHDIMSSDIKKLKFKMAAHAAGNILGYAGMRNGKRSNKRKRFCMLSLVLGSILILCACGSADYSEKQPIIRGGSPVYASELITVGFIQTGKESDWRDANTNDFLHTFTEEKGYNLLYIDGNSEPERQAKAMQDLIYQKVDYIVLDPIVESGWDETVMAAYEAGIPVIIADRHISTDPAYYTNWAGSDFYKEGKDAILWLETYLQEQGRAGERINIVILEGTADASATIGRTKGIREQIEKHPEWCVLTSVCANFLQGEGQTAMEGILEEYTDIDVIIAQNDNMIFGAMEALDRKGLSYGVEGDIIMISFDALGEAFTKLMEGKLHISVECNPLLAGLVEGVIQDLENGKTVEKEIYAQESIFTYKNAADYIADRKY